MAGMSESESEDELPPVFLRIGAQIGKLNSLDQLFDELIPVLVYVDAGRSTCASVDSGLGLTTSRSRSQHDAPSSYCSPAAKRPKVQTNKKQLAQMERVERKKQQALVWFGACKWVVPE